MVARYEMAGGGGRVDVFRAEGPTLEDTIRERLHYPRQKGPFWARRSLEFSLKTPPLHFEKVTQLLVTDGKQNNPVYENNSSWGWSETGVQALTNCVAVAQSGDRQFLIRDEDELLNGPYSQIRIASYTTDLNNLIVVGEAEGRQELHLFDGQGEIAPASGGVLAAKKIEVIEPDAQDLTAMVIATDNDGKQSLLFIDKNSVVPALTAMDRIRYFFSRGFEGKYLSLFAAAVGGQTSFNVFSSSGQLMRTVYLGDSLGLDSAEVDIEHFDSEESMDIIWSHPKGKRPRAYYRNDQLLADKCIAFSDKSGPGKDGWLAVTEPEANVRAVVRNGQIIHQTPLKLYRMEHHADDLGAVVFSKEGTPQEGRMPTIVGYELLCLGPDGGKLLIPGLDSVHPWFDYENGKLTAHVVIGGIKQRVEITAPTGQEELPVAVVTAEPAAA